MPPSSPEMNQVFHSFEDLEYTCFQELDGENNNASVIHTRVSSQKVTPESNPVKQGNDLLNHPSVFIRDNGRTIVFVCNNMQSATVVEASAPQYTPKDKNIFLGASGHAIHEASLNFQSTYRSSHNTTSSSLSSNRAIVPPRVNNSNLPLSLGIDIIDRLLDSTENASLGQQLLDCLGGQSVNLGDVVRLVERGAPVNYQNVLGVSPLMMAAMNQSVPYGIFDYLINLHVRIEAEDKNGDTAFLYASCQPSIHKIKALILHKANVYHRNKRGENCIDKASLADFTNKNIILGFLKQFCLIQSGKKKVKSEKAITQTFRVIKKQRQRSCFTIKSNETTLGNDTINKFCHKALSFCFQHSEYMETFKNGWVYAFQANKKNTKMFVHDKGTLFFPSLPSTPCSGLNHFSFFTTSKRTGPLEIVYLSDSNEHHFVLSKDSKTKKIKTNITIERPCSESSIKLCFPLNPGEWFLCYIYQKVTS